VFEKSLDFSNTGLKQSLKNQSGIFLPDHCKKLLYGLPVAHRINVLFSPGRFKRIKSTPCIVF
jgi:hypothetical protein